MMPRPKKMKRSYILNNYINNSIPSEHVPARQIHATERKSTPWKTKRKRWYLSQRSYLIMSL